MGARALSDLADRRQSARAAPLDREDLYLLMESYKNTVELNTTLLDRQETLNNNIEKVIAELVNICGNQNEIMKYLDNNKDDCKTGHADIVSEMQAARVSEVKEHSAHNNRIYIAFVGMGVIIISLIGLLAKVM